MPQNHIMPNVLRLAAIGCTKPEWIGGILIALVGGKVKLDASQRVVIDMCNAEMAERERRREAAREREARRVAAAEAAK